MLNTGLLIKQPGESSYGRFRRFLIANQTVSNDDIKEEFLRNGFSESKSANNHNGNYWLAKCAAKTEDNFIDEYDLKEQQKYLNLMNRYRPGLCCNVCASYGYHCDLFDFSWLEYCPVHSEKLTNKCNLCGLPWPTPAELLTRNCQLCSATVDLKDIAKMFIDKREKTYLFITVPLMILAKAYKKFDQVFIPYTINGLDFNRTLNDRKSAFFPCIARTNVRTNHMNRERMWLVCSRDYDSVHRTYSEGKVRSKADMLKVHNVALEETAIKLQKVLMKGDHTFGGCRYIDFPKGTCLACATFSVWKQIVEYQEKPIDKFSLYDYKKRLDLRNVYIEERPKKPEIYHQFYVTRKYYSDSFFNLPEELSILIYKNDLWTTAIHIYNRLSYLIHNVEKGNSSWIDIAEGMSEIMKPRNSLFSRYVMKITKKKIDIFFPEILLSNKLRVDSNIEGLLL